MVDLSRKPKKQEPEEEPIGIVILGTIPFAILLWAVLTAGFIGGL